MSDHFVIGGPCRVPGCHDVAGHSGPCPAPYGVEPIPLAIPEHETEAGIKLRVTELQAENARLQARVEAAETAALKWVEDEKAAGIDRDRYKALAEQCRAVLGRYGKHDNGCRYGLLPAGVRRHSFTIKDDARLEAATIKECTCGLRAAIVMTPEEAKEGER